MRSCIATAACAMPATDSRRLELHEHEGAFRRLERWLGEQGFFTPGGQSLAADVYLAYGLSQAIRRTSTPAPPEPCSLPLVACHVRPARPVARRDENGG